MWVHENQQQHWQAEKSCRITDHSRRNDKQLLLLQKQYKSEHYIAKSWNIFYATNLSWYPRSWHWGNTRGWTYWHWCWVCLGCRHCQVWGWCLWSSLFTGTAIMEIPDPIWRDSIAVATWMNINTGWWHRLWK